MTTLSPSSVRYHHFDALRALAMLLGIGLHACISFTGLYWVAQDNSRSEILKWFFDIVHGFRMQLFFLVSGFFTMMLWRKRGLSALLEQRFQRVLVPCVLGLVTIIPLMSIISTWASDQGPQTDLSAKGSKSLLVEAIRTGKIEEIEKLTPVGTNLDEPDSEFGIPPLGWAAFYGNPKVGRLLLDRGADANAPTKDGFRPLHNAFFLGHAKFAELLIERGANPSLQSNANNTLQQSATTDWKLTQLIAGYLRVPLRSEQETEAGRVECLALLTKDRPTGLIHSASERINEWKHDYRDFLMSPRWTLKVNQQGPPYHLFLNFEFSHLWFLWFLCWIVVLFGLCALAAEYTPIPRLGKGLILSPWRMLWLVPMTMVPQLFMGILSPTLGPDTSMGVLPLPHVLLYYGIFFIAGAIYYDCHDQVGKLGKYWWIWMLIAAVSFPIAKETLENSLLSGLLQVIYAWAMIFGLFGLASRGLNREYAIVRYLSDSAYWLYLVHLPLVIFLQAYIRDWDYPALVKFLGLCLVVTVVLLPSYHILVRYTYVGVILNGRRS